MKKILAAILPAVFALALVGCGREQMPAETTDTTVSAVTTTVGATIAETATAETTAPIEASELQITAAPSSLREMEALPADPESAIIKASPAGGNPTFYIFEAGLTYYVRVWNNSIQRETVSLSECTLALPKGYTEGRIAAAACGAGSGEVVLTVLAKEDDKTVCLKYLFYCESVTEPEQIWVEEEPVHVLADNGTITLRTVELPLPEDTAYRAYAYNDRYTVYLRYRRMENAICHYDGLYIVDASAGEVVYETAFDLVTGYADIAYTAEGSVLYTTRRFEDGNTQFVDHAMSLTEENGSFTLREIEMELYPLAEQCCISPDGRYAAYAVQEDAWNNGGLDIKYPDGTVKRICENVMYGDTDACKAKGIGDVVGYEPIGFIDDTNLLYWIGGYEWSFGYGIFNAETGEKTEVKDGMFPETVFDGGFFSSDLENYVVQKYYTTTRNGEKTLLASRDAADGVFWMRDGYYYTFENSMWCAYYTESGESPDSRWDMLQVAFYSPDLCQKLGEIIYACPYELGRNLLIYGNKITVVLPK